MVSCANSSQDEAGDNLQAVQSASMLGGMLWAKGPRESFEDEDGDGDGDEDEEDGDDDEAERVVTSSTGHLARYVALTRLECRDHRKPLEDGA